MAAVWLEMAMSSFLGVLGGAGQDDGDAETEGFCVDGLQEGAAAEFGDVELGIFWGCGGEDGGLDFGSDAGEEGGVAD